MIQILRDFKTTYKVYDKFVAILLPMLILTSILIVIDRIPYLNLFKESISITILSADWFAFVFLSRIRPRSMVKVSFVLLIFAYILFRLKFFWYTEGLANLSFVILSTAILFEIIEMFKEGSED